MSWSPVSNAAMSVDGRGSSQGSDVTSSVPGSSLSFCAMPGAGEGTGHYTSTNIQVSMIQSLATI